MKIYNVKVYNTKTRTKIHLTITTLIIRSIQLCLFSKNYITKKSIKTKILFTTNVLLFHINLMFILIKLYKLNFYF